MPIHNSNRVFHFFMRIFREGGDHFYPFAGNALADEGKITVFAAASLTNAMQDIATQFKKEKGVDVVSSFASSSTLARQIEAGAPADLFISADQKWMDYAVDGEIFLHAGFRCYNDQAIAEQCLTRSCIDRFFINRIIHPFLIGRNKQIRRRTRFNLTGESR